MMETATATTPRQSTARYTLHERLGGGGQGEVWRAHDPRRGVDIALKILRPPPGRSEAAWEALLHEHASASSLDHPHIVKVYEPERQEGNFLLPMELAAGGDLRRLRRASYLAIVPVLIEVAQALEHAHAQGVIHRDLKPGNVLFDARGGVKLVDFGISGRALDPGTDALIRGLSPFSASPEQLRGEPPSAADDIYGLGALAYELLSGHPPHYPNFEARTVQQQPAPPLVPAEPIPPQLGELIARMLAKEASERPASMREVIDELQASLNDTLTFGLENQPSPRKALPMAVAANDAQAASPASPRPTASAARTVTRAETENVDESAPAASVGRGAVDGAALWEEVRHAPLPVDTRLKPMRSGAPRVILLLAALATAALAAYVWLPNYVSTDPISRFLRSAAVSGGLGNEPAPNTGSAAIPPVQEDAPAAAATGHADSAVRGDVGAPGGNPSEKAATAPDVAAQSRSSFTDALTIFDRRLHALESRGAAAWAGADFAAARTRAAEAVRARDAGNPELAQRRLVRATKLLDTVEHAAPAALAAELAAGKRALAEGKPERAQQAFAVANRIDPENRTARDGLERVKAALDDQRYTKAAAEGYAALGAGRLDDARAAFERARALRPDGAEALTGLHRLDTAGGRNVGAMRARAAALESQERWEEAMRVYEDLLRQDRSLTFAQEGRERAARRLLLDESLWDLIDRPDRLSAPQARAQAATLLQEAQEQPDPGPELRGQIARLSALLPGIDKPVHLSLMSDNLTQVAIPSIGTFGSFTRREIQLRPGRYTVIGRREGYRDIHRDIVVSPGEGDVTVNVSCDDPI
jgi:eukaryotic-like serine/threonine-protein kinase